MKVNLESLESLVNIFEDMLKETVSEEKEETSKVESVAQEETCEESHDYDEECLEISDDVFSVDKDSYILNLKVNDANINDTIDLEFDHYDEEEEYNVPGITEKQLLTVLLYRNKDNKERYELIKKLLF